MNNRRIRGCGLLLLAAGSIGVNSSAAQAKPLTAREVIARIQEHVGIPWMQQTVDTFKAGNPETEVKGIAVTMMATLDVLQRAAAAGQNLVITHEPTFFNHQDKPDDLEQKDNDPVLAAKRAFIEEHGLVIWRFHDHWHRMKQDGIEAGMAHALGWEKFQDSGNQYLFAIPETDLDHLATDLKSRLNIRIMRVVGDPKLKVKKVALVPGASGFAKETRALEINDVQVLITGEPRVSVYVGTSERRLEIERHLIARRGKRFVHQKAQSEASLQIARDCRARMHCLVDGTVVGAVELPRHHPPGLFI